ncbi:hypothetical protein BZA70DRAFT_276658, partial [Myxozyma melibiosi]
TTGWYLFKEVTLLSVCTLFPAVRLSLNVKSLVSGKYWLGIPSIFFCETLTVISYPAKKYRIAQDWGRINNPDS